jgi:BlaI family penicillinase repressor
MAGLFFLCGLGDLGGSKKHIPCAAAFNSMEFDRSASSLVIHGSAHLIRFTRRWCRALLAGSRGKSWISWFFHLTSRPPMTTIKPKLRNQKRRHAVSNGCPIMARPKASELTERELEVMHVFWNRGEQTVAAARDDLAASGRNLAYTTVATLVRILVEKGFLKQTNEERPFRFQPLRSFEEVSGNLVTDLVRRVFGGSREELLVRLMEQRNLTPRERAVLQSILSEKKAVKK